MNDPNEPSSAAPDFTLQTFEGDTLELADYRGQHVVVLNFAGSWCPPCHDEADTLERTYRDYQAEDVLFVGVFGNDTEPEAMEFIDRYDITYPAGLDTDSRIAGQFRVTGYPETFVINLNGEVAEHFIGPVTDMRLRDAIEEALE